MHLKTAVSYLGKRMVLANREWVDAGALAEFTVIDVPAEERWAANALRIGEPILMPSAFPNTRKILEEAAFQLASGHTTQLAKAETGMTCLELRFQDAV